MPLTTRVPTCHAAVTTVSGLRAVPGVCDRFVTCYKGAARVQQCPPGTHFCVKSLMCDWPTKAVCDQVVTTHVWI